MVDLSYDQEGAGQEGQRETDGMGKNTIYLFYKIVRSIPLVCLHADDTLFFLSRSVGGWVRYGARQPLCTTTLSPNIIIILIKY